MGRMTGDQWRSYCAAFDEYSNANACEASILWPWLSRDVVLTVVAHNQSRSTSESV
jgi:hypothetical protein